MFVEVHVRWDKRFLSKGKGLLFYPNRIFKRQLLCQRLKLLPQWQHSHY